MNLKDKTQNVPLVTKASGEQEPFDENKLHESLRRSGASQDAIGHILAHLRGEVRDGMPTRDIYRHAYVLLKKIGHPLAAKYSLKRAIFDFGPSGYAFESYVAELLKAQGYEIALRVGVPGFCVEHEIDVIGKKDNRHILVECKFHNQSGRKSDIKAALYVQARFVDIKKRWEQEPEHLQEYHEAWFVTNTKVTHDAIRYSQCIGMKILSWNYPAGGGLRELIESTSLHPVTCLTSLTRAQKISLLEQNFVLARQLVDRPNILGTIGLTGGRAERVINESAGIIKLGINYNA